MLKKENKLFILLILSLLLFGCTKSNAIKKEYESLNGKNDYRVVRLSKDNPYKVITDEELDIKLGNKDTFVLIYASSKDNYSRSVIDIVSDVALYYGIKDVYYINREDDVPQLVGYIDGLLSGMTNCISGYQMDPMEELTKEIKDDSKEKITNVIKPVADELSSCDDHGDGC